MFKQYIDCCLKIILNIIHVGEEEESYLTASSPTPVITKVWEHICYNIINCLDIVTISYFM